MRSLIRFYLVKALNMVEMPVPSVVMATMQTTATRDSSKPYSTREGAIFITDELGGGGERLGHGNFS